MKRQYLLAELRRSLRLARSPKAIEIKVQGESTEVCIAENVVQFVCIKRAADHLSSIQAVQLTVSRLSQNPGRRPIYIKGQVVLLSEFREILPYRA